MSPRCLPTRIVRRVRIIEWVCVDGCHRQIIIHPYGSVRMSRVTQMMQMMDDVPFNPFPRSTIKGSVFVKEPFWGGGKKKLKRQLANERRKNVTLGEANAINRETIASQRSTIVRKDKDIADANERVNVVKAEAAIVKEMEKNNVKKTAKEENEDGMADILMGVNQEGFAVKFTNPKYDTENALMTKLYNSVTADDTENWIAHDHYKALSTDDYVNFGNDVKTTFNERYADISDNIASLKSHQEHYRAVEPLTDWIKGNSENLTNELESLAIDTETNERRAEYENQVVEVNKTWKVIVTVIFVMAVCVFLFYEIRSLFTVFSWGRVWTMVWKLVLMGLYLFSVDYILFQFWAIVRYSLYTVRQALHV